MSERANAAILYCGSMPFEVLVETMLMVGLYIGKPAITSDKLPCKLHCCTKDSAGIEAGKIAGLRQLEMHVVL